MSNDFLLWRLIRAEQTYKGDKWDSGDEDRLTVLYQEMKSDAFEEKLAAYEKTLYAATRSREADKERRDVWHCLQGVL